MSTELAPRPRTELAAGPFSHPNYTVKRPFWSLLGRKFRVYDPLGNLVLFVKHPLLKMRQEFQIYADEAQTTPLLTVKARQVIALNVIYDVLDTPTGQRLGSVRTRGLRSIFRDTFDLLDETDQPSGKVEEEGFALLRRLFPILTGKWAITVRDTVGARIRQVFHFFVKEYTLDLSMAPGLVDARFALACTLLALMRETERENR